MRIKYFVFVVFFLFYYSIAFNQVTTQPEVNNFLVGMELLYYHPKIDDFNTGLVKIEDNLSLLKWKDFRIDYLTIVSLTYNFDRKNHVSLQTGGSYFENIRND